MLKDPYCADDTAYELLGLPFDVALPEVREALKRFMRERGRKTPHLLGAAAQAQKKLQSPVGRAEIDIWLYDIDLSRDPAVPAEPLDLDEFSRPRALAPSELYTDIKGVDMEADKRTIVPQKLKFSDIRAFDDIESILLVPKFDR